MDRRNLLKSAGATLALSATGAVALLSTPANATRKFQTAEYYVGDYLDENVFNDPEAMGYFKKLCRLGLDRAGQIVSDVEYSFEWQADRQRYLGVGTALIIPNKELQKHGVSRI